MPRTATNQTRGKAAATKTVAAKSGRARTTSTGAEKPTRTTQATVEQMLDEMTPETHPVRDGRHLRRIGDALSALESAEQELHDAVSAAHEAGDSWTAISLVLGTSRQAAHRKYATRW